MDVSWDHGNSDVTRLALASGKSAYLKRFRSPRKFEQERSAYRDWCPRLPHCARLLGATTEPARALLVNAMPGRPLLGRSGPGDSSSGALPHEDQRAAYAKAGAFLATLHGLDADDTDPVAVPDAWRLRTQTWAKRAGPVLDAESLTAVMEIAAAPWPSAAPVPKRVPCHRDFTERNWLVDGPHFTVIDFEHARLDWSLVDVERTLSSIPKGVDGLAESFLKGYGWSNRPEDMALLRRVSAVAALCQVVWAVEHRDAAFEHAGRERLTHCLRSGTL